MHQSDSPRKTAQTDRQRRTGPLALLVLGPLVPGLLISGCETIEDATDYVGDLFSYVEDDEIFGDGAVPGADEPYRSLSEVPGATPAVASAQERDALSAGLVADREKAQHTAATIRVGDGQVRAIYRPARDEADTSPPGGA